MLKMRRAMDKLPGLPQVKPTRAGDFFRRLNDQVACTDRYVHTWDWARFEVVGHKWADVSEADYGVSLINNCKYGYNVKDNTLRLTLLKSSKYPDTEADMGEHDFAYALLPHSGTVTQGDTIEESVKFNSPIQVIPSKLRRADKKIIYLAYITHLSNPLCGNDFVSRVQPCYN